MNVNRLVVLSKSAHIAKRLLACDVRHAGKEVLHFQQRRSIKTHARHLSYAKDLFLGQVNKVRYLVNVNALLTEVQRNERLMVGCVPVDVFSLT